MSGFGSLWRIRTRKHIRTMRSIRASTGAARELWPRQRETEERTREERRRQCRRRLHDRRRIAGALA